MVKSQQKAYNQTSRPQLAGVQVSSDAHLARTKATLTHTERRVQNRPDVVAARCVDAGVGLRITSGCERVPQQMTRGRRMCVVAMYVNTYIDISDWHWCLSDADGRIAFEEEVCLAGNTVEVGTRLTTTACTSVHKCV